MLVLIGLAAHCSPVIVGSVGGDIPRFLKFLQALLQLFWASVNAWSQSW
jgi:hypothetical protein